MDLVLFIRFCRALFFLLVTCNSLPSSKCNHFNSVVLFLGMILFSSSFVLVILFFTNKHFFTFSFHSLLLHYWFILLYSRSHTALLFSTSNYSPTFPVIYLTSSTSPCVSKLYILYITYYHPLTTAISTIITTC